MTLKMSNISQPGEGQSCGTGGIPSEWLMALVGQGDSDDPVVCAARAELSVRDERMADFFKRLLGTRFRMVARGEGTVHLYVHKKRPSARVEKKLWAALSNCWQHIDACASMIRFDEAGCPRVTTATQAIARLRAEGHRLHATCGGVLVSYYTDGRHLADFSETVKREMWFRLLFNMPDPLPAVSPLAATESNVLAGLHRHCEVNAHRVRAPRKGRSWDRYAEAIGEIRAGQGGPSETRTELALYCRQQAERLERQGRDTGRWRRWADALTE